MPNYWQGHASRKAVRASELKPWCQRSGFLSNHFKTISIAWPLVASRGAQNRKLGSRINPTLMRAPTWPAQTPAASTSSTLVPGCVKAMKLRQPGITSFADDAVCACASGAISDTRTASATKFNFTATTLDLPGKCTTIRRCWMLERWYARPMPTPLTPPTLERVLQGLHNSEIRCGIQNEPPAGGITAWIDYGSRTEKATVYGTIVGDQQVWPAADRIAAWMHETALRLFPDSPCAKAHGG